MEAAPKIQVPEARMRELCREFQVRELSLFGSVLREDFREDSDVDVLVTFQPQVRVGFFTLSRLQYRLEDLFGRKVDLDPKDGLKPLIRDSVISSSRVVYAG